MGEKPTEAEDAADERKFQTLSNASREAQPHEPAHTPQQQQGRVGVQGWDPKEKKPISG